MGGWDGPAKAKLSCPHPACFEQPQQPAPGWGEQRVRSSALGNPESVLARGWPGAPPPPNPCGSRGREPGPDPPRRKDAAAAAFAEHVASGGEKKKNSRVFLVDILAV